MVGIWNVGDVGYSGFWKLRRWDIRDMECFGCGMSGL